MTRSQKAAAWARVTRDRLIAQLGGSCALCGKRARLEFDHPNGRDWEPRKTSRWMRVIRYRREIERGLIRLLCRRCNARDGGSRRYS